MKLADHLIDLKRLELVKSTKVAFNNEVERINEHMHNEDVEMKRIDDHLIALDQYLDKYQPVRMEDMITEHLDACLMGDQRIKHKLYGDSKVQLIFKALLEDTGTTLKIQDLIKNINGIARRRVDEEEKE
jgi:hypothetical protein